MMYYLVRKETGYFLEITTISKCHDNMEEREIMRKRLLKLTSMVLAGSMLVSMVTGCGSSNTTTETQETQETQKTQETEKHQQMENYQFMGTIWYGMVMFL